MLSAATKRYRAVIIGHTGRGNYGHGWDQTWNSFPNVEVAAVADPDDAGRQKAMERCRARQGYRDYREMLAKEKPDIVTICPRWLDRRLEIFTAAVEARAHILVEKPFAPNLDQATRMLELARRARIKVQVGHTARPMGVTQRVLQMLRDRELGVLQEIRARGKEDRRAGGEDLMVLGTHDFDLMRYFAGDPQWVFAHATENGREVRAGMEHEATEPVGKIAGNQIAAMFAFADGVNGYFASKASDVIDGKRFGVTLYGSKAMVYVPLTEVPSGAPYLLRNSAWAGGAWERIEYPEHTRITAREQVNAIMGADLLEAIEKDREPICSALDAWWTIAMVDGVYRSQSTGSRVPLSAPAQRG